MENSNITDNTKDNNESKLKLFIFTWLISVVYK